MFRCCLSKSCKPKVEHPVKDSGTSSETLVDVAAVEGYFALDESTLQVPTMETTHRYSYRFCGFAKLEVGDEPSP